MEYLINNFCSYLGVRRSVNTVSAYRTDLKQFASYLSREQGIQDWSIVLGRHIDSYIMLLSTSGAKRSTMSRKLASISSFYKFLIRQGVTTTNPATDVESIRIPRRAPDFMSKEEIKVARSTSQHDNLLEGVVVELLLSTGMRVSEMCSLDRDSVDLENLSATVVGKGDKQRTVFLSERARDLITHYLSQRVDSYPPLLILKDKRINRFQVYTMVKRIGRRYLGRKLNPHLFRHTIATHSALNGMPLQELQEVLGHSNINTTMRYVHPSKQIRQHHAHVIESFGIEDPEPDTPLLPEPKSKRKRKNKRTRDERKGE